MVYTQDTVTEISRTNCTTKNNIRQYNAIGKEYLILVRKFI